MSLAIHWAFGTAEQKETKRRERERDGLSGGNVERAAGSQARPDSPRPPACAPRREGGRTFGRWGREGGREEGWARPSFPPPLPFVSLTPVTRSGQEHQSKMDRWRERRDGEGGKVIEVVRPPSSSQQNFETERDLPPLLLCPPSDIRGHSIKLKSARSTDSGRKSRIPRFTTNGSGVNPQRVGPSG